MILGGSLGVTCGMSTEETRGFVMFPLVVHAFDLVASGTGVAAAARSAVGVRSLGSGRVQRGGLTAGSQAGAEAEPIAILKRGQRIAVGDAAVGLVRRAALPEN
jgi:hypothetical protein